MSDTFLENMKERGTFWAKSKITQFITEEELEGLPKKNKDDLNQMDLGVIILDDSGQVLFFNEYEAAKSGVSRQAAEGKHFFTEVAPCTNNMLFSGSFEKGIQEKEMNLLFPYTFTYKMKPTPVRVQLYRDPGTSSNWVLVKWP